MLHFVSTCARAGAAAAVRLITGRHVAHALAVPRIAAVNLPGLAIACMLCGCATPPAPDIRGKWQSVNHYPDATQAIALQRAYVYRPTPMDHTLRTMLARWAADTGRTLDYAARDDYTLHAAVAMIQTNDPRRAAALLDDAFSVQRLAFAIDTSHIEVRVADAGIANVGATQ